MSHPRPRCTGHAALLASTLAAFGCSDSAVEPVELGALALELVANGFDAPVLVTSAPGDDRLFVVERSGRIRIVEGGTTLPDPFLDVSSDIAAGNERGLLGLTFHPGYSGNGRFFVNYTEPGGNTRIVEYTLATQDRAAPSSMRVVLEVAQPFSNHNGGHLAFGPDGMLYIGMGDGGDGGDPQNHGQRPITLLGSMLRIDVDGAAPYAVPSDNPFVGSPSAAPETWAYGLRNPWRFSFDRDTGDLYVGDVGQTRREEVSFQPASSSGGENYGWNRLEGTLCYPGGTCDDSGTVLPLHEYDHGDGCSITGGYVYRGGAVPGLRGRYIFGDYCGGWIRSFVQSGGNATDVRDHSADLGTVSNLSSFGEDGSGELYVVSLDGAVYRIVEGS